MFIILSRIILISVVSIAALFFYPSNTYADHSPEHYYVDWFNTNFYLGTTLSYSLDELSTGGDNYTFTLQQMNPVDNTVIQNIWTVILPNTTVSTVINFPGLIINERVFLHDDEIGFLRVIDNHGQIVGKHMTANAPHTHWEQDGHNEEIYRTGIGAIHTRPFNIWNLFHYEFDTRPITTSNGGYSILHYRVEDVDPIEQWIEIRNLDSTDMIYYIDVNNIVDYNWHRNLSAISPTIEARNNFVLISTSPHWRQFMDMPQAEYAFPPNIFNAWAFLNPMWADSTLDYRGAYDYARLDDEDDVLAIGESVWFIIDSNVIDKEWNLTARDSVRENGTQIVTITSRTPAVNAGFDWQGFADSEIGPVFGEVDGSFLAKKTVSYTIGDAAENILIQYRRYPDSPNYTTFPDNLLYSFFLLHNYDIVPKVPPIELVNNLINESQYDRDLIIGVLFLLSNLFLFAIIASIQRRIGQFNARPYMVAYIGLALLFILPGWMRIMLAIPTGFSATILFIVMLVGGRKND